MAYFTTNSLLVLLMPMPIFQYIFPANWFFIMRLEQQQQQKKKTEKNHCQLPPAIWHQSELRELRAGMCRPLHNKCGCFSICICICACAKHFGLVLVVGVSALIQQFGHYCWPFWEPTTIYNQLGDAARNVISS